MSYNIDPELLPFLDLIPSVSNSDLLDARASAAEWIEAMSAELDVSGVQTEDRTIPGPEGAPEVPIRIYRPEGVSEVRPALLQIHGGAFVLGNLDCELINCIPLCRTLQVPVISVDYRLSPETPFPGGLYDCYAALCWLAQNAAGLRVDPARIAVIGHSAGGCLSAATALLAKERGGPALCFQYLGFPALDDRLITTSMMEFDDTPVWTRSHTEAAWDYYLGDGHQRGSDDVPHLAAPLRATVEQLRGLPPAYISVMEFDPLRDEGLLYALNLLRAGVQTEVHSFPGTFHGSSAALTARVAQREHEEMMAVLRHALALDSHSN